MSTFTLDEDRALRRLYPFGSWETMLATLKGRTQRQIGYRARCLGLARGTKAAKSWHEGANRPAKAAPAPAPPRPIGRPRLAETPVLDARKSTKGKSEGSPIGRMLEEMRKLSPTHPRRLAYAQAARTGTGHDAYLVWRDWPKQQKGGGYA